MVMLSDHDRGIPPARCHYHRLGGIAHADYLGGAACDEDGCSGEGPDDVDDYHDIACRRWAWAETIRDGKHGRVHRVTGHGPAPRTPSRHAGEWWLRTRLKSIPSAHT